MFTRLVLVLSITVYVQCQGEPEFSTDFPDIKPDNKDIFALPPPKDDTKISKDGVLDNSPNLGVSRPEYRAAHSDLMCKQCNQYTSTFGKVTIANDYDERLTACPVKPCYQGDTICAVLQYEVGNYLFEKFGCANNTLIDAVCPDMRCLGHESTCLKMQLTNRTMQDCSYRHTLGTSRLICSELREIKPAMGNCTVRPTRVSCQCVAQQKVHGSTGWKPSTCLGALAGAILVKMFIMS